MDTNTVLILLAILAAAGLGAWLIMSKNKPPHPTPGATVLRVEEPIVYGGGWGGWGGLRGRGWGGWRGRRW